MLRCEHITLPHIVLLLELHLRGYRQPLPPLNMAIVETKAVAQPDMNVKLLILGDSSVGKTSILVRFTNQYFDSTYLMTIGMFHCSIDLLYIHVSHNASCPRYWLQLMKMHYGIV